MIIMKQFKNKLKTHYKGYVTHVVNQTKGLQLKEKWDLLGYYFSYKGDEAT